MKKVYKIFELISTSQEVFLKNLEYGYGQKTSYSCLYRSIDDTNMNWDKRSLLEDGFNTLEEAEQFIAENIGEYDTWTIVCEYRKTE